MEIEAIWKLSNLKSRNIESVYMKSMASDGTPSASIFELSMTSSKEKQLFDSFIKNAKSYDYPTGPIGHFEYESKPALYYSSMSPTDHPQGCCVILGSESLKNISNFEAYILIQNILAPERNLNDVIKEPDVFIESYQPTEAEMSPYKKQLSAEETTSEEIPTLQLCGFSCF